MKACRSSIGLILAVAGVYSYFLLFAQFALLERIKSVTGEGATLKAILALMVMGGVAAGFLAARKGRPLQWMSMALIGCAGVAFIASLTLPQWAFPILSFATGIVMGIVTVTLAGRIAAMPDRRKGCLLLGWGTGLAYAFCNIPIVFTAHPSVQCLVSAAVALVALAGARMMGEGESRVGLSFIPWRAISVFGALVWLDSAAFYIIQHVAELKAATWSDELLWRNAGIHLITAVIAGWWLSGGGLRWLWITAWALLALAAWWVNFPACREWVGWLYPAGVSLYSTALVAWPGLLSGDQTGDRRNPAMSRAAWLFGISGWLASGMGIGMAESLHQVPPMFLIASGVTVLAGAFTKRLDLRSLAIVGFIGLAAALSSPAPQPPRASAQRGHDVYVSEGCIHCHSRYVRPGSTDESMWGPAANPNEITAEKPVLIGNRRQGPDLLHVGGRRSAIWLREHFRNPRAFSPDSAMPAYVHLLQDGRGEDLISYLLEDQAGDIAGTWETALSWKPPRPASGNPNRGGQLFATSCAVCHGSKGEGDGLLASAMRTPPRNLVRGPFGFSGPRPEEPLETSVMRVIRFGIPGTDMPGHETWNEQELADIASWVSLLRR